MAQTFSFKISVEQNGRQSKDPDAILSREFTLQELLEFTKSSLLIAADEGLKEEQGKGFDKNPIVIVDGNRGKGIGQVSPLGQIEFVSTTQDFGAILLEAYLGLLSRSKVLTGLYKSSHYVFWNGVQVAVDLGSLQSWLGLLGQGPKFKPGDSIRIVNIQPYARRLELLGVTAQRSKTKRDEVGRRKGQKTGRFIKIPNGAYQLTSRSIRSKYKQNVIISFSFLPGSSMGLTASFKGGRKGRNSAGRPYLYPSILFTIQERGTNNE